MDDRVFEYIKDWRKGRGIARSWKSICDGPGWLCAFLSHVWRECAEPEVQSVHPRLTKLHIAKRLEAIKSGEGIDWSTAEALAFGTLMQDGYHVRICGQDSGRVSPLCCIVGVC